MEISLGKASSKILVAFALASLLAGAAWADTFTGPVSKYYADYGGTIFVVQGTSVESIAMAYGSGEWESALAVSDTIRTRAGDMRAIFFGTPDQGAGEYTLSGTPTGHGYLTPASGNLRYYDGTTDGTYDYFVDHGQVDPLTGGVYRADYYWQDPQFLFYPQAICGYPPGCQGLSGIAFDPTNSSLWISARGGPLIGDYSLDGVLLAEFYAGVGNQALGLDPADHTLWLATGLTGLLQQYSLDGATFGELLQEGRPDGLPAAYFSSGDFQEPVPEPATFLLLLPVTALIGFRVRSTGRRGPGAGHYWKLRRAVTGSLVALSLMLSVSVARADTFHINFSGEISGAGTLITKTPCSPITAAERFFFPRGDAFMCVFSDWESIDLIVNTPLNHTFEYDLYSIGEVDSPPGAPPLPYFDPQSLVFISTGSGVPFRVPIEGLDNDLFLNSGGSTEFYCAGCPIPETAKGTYVATLVPEPSSVLLFATVAGIVFLVSRRRCAEES